MSNEPIANCAIKIKSKYKYTLQSTFWRKRIKTNYAFWFSTQRFEKQFVRLAFVSSKIK